MQQAVSTAVQRYRTPQKNRRPYLARSAPRFRHHSFRSCAAPAHSHVYAPTLHPNTLLNHLSPRRRDRQPRPSITWSTGVQDMTRFLLAGAAAFGLLTGVATAQTSETVTTTAPTVLVPPPPGTLSTTVTKKAVGPDGSLGYSQSSTYNNGTGVTNNTTTATYPPAPPPPPSVTTQQTTTTTTQPQ